MNNPYVFYVFFWECEIFLNTLEKKFIKYMLKILNIQLLNYEWNLNPSFFSFFLRKTVLKCYYNSSNLEANFY